MSTCAICLERLKTPVSTPCGHIHCNDCLNAHVTAGADALKATCPTCRASFSIVTLDKAFVPTKYHPFLLTPVRRVFLDDTERKAHKAQIKALDARVKTLEREKGMLLERAEANLRRASACAEGERSARLEAQTMREQRQRVERLLEQALEKVDRRTRDLQELRAAREAVDRPAAPATPRKSETKSDDLPSFDDLFSPLPAPASSSTRARHSFPNFRPVDNCERYYHPLPKRKARASASGGEVKRENTGANTADANNISNEIENAPDLDDPSALLGHRKRARKMPSVRSFDESIEDQVGDASRGEGTARMEASPRRSGRLPQFRPRPKLET